MPESFGRPVLTTTSAPLDWARVRRVLIVRLRSIGDTVLATPALRALRRFQPDARIDLLLEDWVAPLIEGHPDIDDVVVTPRGSLVARLRTALRLRRARYDVAFNLHGGTTATFMTRASGARRRIGYARYQLGPLHNDLMPPASLFWGREDVHSVEEQLALLGFAGIPVADRPPTRLHVSPQSRVAIAARLRGFGLGDDAPLGLLHPATSLETKRWPAAGFARVAEHLARRGLTVVAIANPDERTALDELRLESEAAIHGLLDLSLPEVAALAERCRIFVGNDSGIAHIAAAVRAPVVVIFGSSNVVHWRPWSTAPAEVVRHPLPCQPCPGYSCSATEPLGCIRRIPVGRVIEAVDSVLERADENVRARRNEE